MLTPLIAAGDWALLFKVGVFIIVGIYWMISTFAKKVQTPPARRPRPLDGPLPGEPQQPTDPLQAEIDEFLRKAQAQREGRPDEPARPIAPPTAQPARRPRPKRRSVGTIKRESPQRPPPLPQPATPVVVEAVSVDRPRESLAAQLAQRQESSVFDQRARTLSHVQQASDNEFQQHMQRVFDHDLGKLKPAAMGMFEAAGAAAAAVTAQAASAAAAGAQSSTAPTTVHKRTSDIALFLAGKKNVRDAVILTEILRRPEERW